MIAGFNIDFTRRFICIWEQACCIFSAHLSLLPLDLMSFHTFFQTPDFREINLCVYAHMCLCISIFYAVFNIYEFEKELCVLSESCNWIPAWGIHAHLLCLCNHCLSSCSCHPLHDFFLFLPHNKLSTMLVLWILQKSGQNSRYAIITETSQMNDRNLI